MTLLDDRLISPNGLEIARFFDGAHATSGGADVDDEPTFEDDDLDMAYTVWN